MTMTAAAATLRRCTPSAAALAAAATAMAVSTLVPLLGPLLLALALGALVANLPWPSSGELARHAGATKVLLRWGVVLLGLRISGADLLDVGASGLCVVVATVALTYTATVRAGRRLGLDPGLVVLVAAGFSICGAAAIAAVNDVVRARQRDAALAVGLVTVYGSAMILALPALASALRLSDRQAAVWAGASIHEVAQVAAAASLIGAPVIAVAMTVKLGRVLLLAPVCLAAARGAGAPGARPPLVPWFVGAFAVAVAVRTTGLLGEDLLDAASLLTTLLLSAGMFGLGLAIRVKDLWPVPRSALLLAALATAVAAGSSLVLVVLTIS